MGKLLELYNIIILYNLYIAWGKSAEKSGMVLNVTKSHVTEYRVLFVNRKQYVWRG